MKSKQYKDKLNPKSASEGIRLANENATSLLADAQLLFDHERFERSVALSILAIEEAGKSSIVRAILLTDDQKSLKKEWQNYRRHTEKNLTWILPELVSKGARQLEDLNSIYDSKSDHGQTLDNIKQLSIYTDVFSSCKWSIPSNVINKDLATSIISIALILVKKETDGLNSEKGFELWVKHIKPVWKHEMFKMKQALINCYNEAEKLGIIEEGKTNEMIKFLI